MGEPRMNESAVWDCHVKPTAEVITDDDPDGDEEGEGEIEVGTAIPAGDPDWIAAHAELLPLHLRKSSTYGNADDPLANFTTVADFNGDDPEVYVIERCIEKLTRALNMIRVDRAGEVKEYSDVASLMLCAEALRRRR